MDIYLVKSNVKYPTSPELATTIFGYFNYTCIFLI